MRAVDLIVKKRHGGELSAEEIGFLINGYVSGDVPDYQIAAWAMAVCFQGMSERETADLTRTMLESGEQVDLSGIAGVKVDKHSTGGVGDKTTLVLIPLVAAAGVPVAKMSGRGLGHTGGTLDKLESIPGFSVSLNQAQFIRQVNDIGLAVVGQTGHLAPADKQLYALRDVTGTVDSIPLIASSVMSKKLATGADAIVLDVKVGRGAFMKTRDEAFELAQTMVNIGKRLKRKTVAVVSDMNQPLGHAVGNALEVKEAIAMLEGNTQGSGCSRDLRDLCLELGSRMLVATGRESNPDQARQRLKELLESGQALHKLKTLISAQGGDSVVIKDKECLPQAPIQKRVTTSRNGIIKQIEAEQIGLAAMSLGAGRERKDSILDLSVGIVLHKKIGDHLTAGEAIATIHASDERMAEHAATIVTDAIEITHGKVTHPTLIYGVVE